MEYGDKEIKAQFERIYSRLDKIGRTWDDFVDALGLYPQTINNWKNRGIPRRRWPDIAEFLGITIDELLGRTAPAPVETAQGWPFPNVPRERFARLQPSQKLMVEAAMVEALEQVEHRQREKNRPPKRPGGTDRAQPG